MDVVIFELGARRCGVTINAVEEVLSVGPVTPVPTAPPAVAGAMNVRGQICPILRLENLLGQTSGTRPRQGQPCLLVRARDCLVVLCVGRIEEVARIGRGSLLSSGGGDLVISGVVDTSAGPLQLVDVEHAVQRVTRQVRELTARLH